jgi:hypothetical protein
MVRNILLIAVFACLFSASSAHAQEVTLATLQGDFDKTARPFLQTYCITCHSGERPKGQIDLSTFSTLDSISKEHATWKIILDQISSKDMPPDTAKTLPDDSRRAAMVDWIKQFASFESSRNAGDPGTVLARRLSNAEYDNSVRDLTGVDIRPTKEFPIDPANQDGFDNSGESLAMSPALISKYLDAARQVASHVVLKPNGFDFSDFPISSEEDRDKYAVRQIIDFYQRQPTNYADYFEAAWRFHNRAALGQRDATLAGIASAMKISPKYLAAVYAMLSQPAEDLGAIAAVQARWGELPGPAGDRAIVRKGCEALATFVSQLREKVKFTTRNLATRGIADGSQPLVLWKNEQYAKNRRIYPGGALSMEYSPIALQLDPQLAVPADASSRATYEDSFKRFCDIFPDAFVVSERSRVFLENAREAERDKRDNTGRYLSAGFHSQMGYFRDDQPLYDLVLGDADQKQLDELWRELYFITLAPIQQHKQFIWFERAEPPSFMYSPEFNSFRSEDDAVASEKRIRELAELYLAKAKSGGASQVSLDVIAKHFEWINSAIRAVEADRLQAEPKHLDAMLAFAERAYRRPLAPAEREKLLAFYQLLRADAQLNHDDAIRDCVASVLMSPHFSYRIDLPATAGDGIQPISDYALASRLSYFLWSSMPDAELLARAKAGDLHEPAVLLAQTKRMIADPKIRGLATEFLANWLDVRRFEELNSVDRERFPTFTNELRSAMFEEPVRFFVNLVQNDRPVLEMLYGDYTFVNPVLAAHYGIPEPNVRSGDEWVRIDNASQYHRGGVLPMAAFLTKNAPGLRTSPVKRGYWVVRRILGEHIPAPPPNVPQLPTDESKLGDLTLRQTLERHRADVACAGCHERFDGVGLVFEGYGPTGESRAKDLGDRLVQTKAVFPGGTEGDGLAGLQTYLREHRQNDFLDNVCRKLLVFGLGRGLLASDEPLIAEMREKLSKNENRVDTIIQSIVTSRQFLNQRGYSMASR